MERVHQVYLSIPGDRFTDLSTGRDISFAATDLPLRESCRDLIRTTDTTRCLAHRRHYSAYQAMLPLAGDSQEPVPQFKQPKFMLINDSPRAASFLAFHNSWLATLARAVEEVWWK